MIPRYRPTLIFAIYFHSRGFVFVLFDTWINPIDRGAREIDGPDREARCLDHVDALLSLHTPDVLVLQDTSRRGTRRAPRIQALNRQTCTLAKGRGIPVHAYSRAQVVNYFEDLGAETKQGMAERLARELPPLSLYVPSPRKPWNSEDPRMGIFDAAALAWMFLHSGKSRREEDLATTTPRDPVLAGIIHLPLLRAQAAPRPRSPMQFSQPPPLPAPPTTSR